MRRSEVSHLAWSMHPLPEPETDEHLCRKRPKIRKKTQTLSLAAPSFGPDCEEYVDFVVEFAEPMDPID